MDFEAYKIKARDIHGCYSCSRDECRTADLIAEFGKECYVQGRRSAFEEAAEMMDHYCSFDENQQSRHSWHDKQYALEQMRAKVKEADESTGRKS